MAEVVKSTIQKRDGQGTVRHGAEWLTLWADPESVKTKTQKKADAALRLKRSEIERRIAAAARSIAGDPELQILISSSPQPDQEEIEALRGEIDAYALKRRFHSAEIHRSHTFSDAQTQKLFDLCEGIRCEALGARRFAGIQHNLVARHRRRLQESNLLNAHLALLIPLAEGLRMVLRDSLLGVTEPSIASSGFWMWDQWLRSKFSPQLRALQLAQNDQAQYAEVTGAFIHDILQELGSSEETRWRLETSASRSGLPAEESDEPSATRRTKEDKNGEMMEPGGSLFLDDDKPAAKLLLEQEPEVPAPYSVFTIAHDRVARAEDLADPAVLQEARAELTRKRTEFRRDFARLVGRLQRRLLTLQVRDWSFDLDEGLLDASRLDRVVVDRGFASAYKQERETKFRDTTVSILIDNSGSMRGKPIQIACLASDMISAALERCGVGCEILGFTTAGWKGGAAAQDWVRAGRPANPGRLNDVLHIIYKSADEPTRRSRFNICAMLEPALLKENLDGEALLWASRRLLARSERRKILIVISDGAPMDQATLENNSDKQILDRHLCKVISEIESSKGIELAAIGVKHNLSRYYSNAVQIATADNLGISLVGLLDTLLVEKARSQQRPRE